MYQGLLQRSPCPQKDLGSATYTIELSNPFVESPAALSLNTTIFIIYWDPIGLKHAAGGSYTQRISHVLFIARWSPADSSPNIVWIYDLLN